MRKAVLLFTTLIAVASASAQIPVNRTMTMVEKSTASWCVPCGNWGWTLQEELIADNMVGALPNAIVLETHGQLSGFHTGVADSLIQGWQGPGIPEWAVNNRRHQTEDRAGIKRTVDSIVAIAPAASAAFYYTLVGNTITFNTRTRFWKNGAGTYSIGAYIIEDSAYGEQQGLLPGNIGYHRYVLRDHISRNVFGDTLVSGNVWNWQNFTKNYTYVIKRTDWVKNHLKFMTVVWKRNGTAWNSWEVVNVNSVGSAYLAKVLEIAHIAVDQLLVYPNPANDKVHISGALTVDADARISVINAPGQMVYEKTVPYNGGQLAEDIDTYSLSNGIYTLLIRTEGAQTLRKLVVAR